MRGKRLGRRGGNWGGEKDLCRLILLLALKQGLPSLELKELVKKELVKRRSSR
jgi:hypothetical protein